MSRCTDLHVRFAYSGLLMSLNISKTGILNQESGKALAGALKVNSVLRELDVSSSFERYLKGSQDSLAFAQELAHGLSTNTSLQKLLMGANEFKGAEAGEAVGNAIAANTAIKETLMPNLTK